MDIVWVSFCMDVGVCHAKAGLCLPGPRRDPSLPRGACVRMILLKEPSENAFPDHLEVRVWTQSHP